MNIPFLLGLIVTASFLISIPPAEVYALTPAQVYDKVKDSVVVVKSLDEQGGEVDQGSGVILPSGKIGTCCHVLEGGISFQVGRGEKFVPSAFYGGDEDKDICLLEARGLGGKPAQLGRAGDLKVGVPVYVVGAPKDPELSIRNAVVSRLRDGQSPLIQTTAVISANSSGGGLFDGEGRLVALASLFAGAGQELIVAIPVEWIGEVKPGRRAAGENRRIRLARRAAAFQNNGDWQGSLDVSLRWTKIYPDDADAWFSLGYNYGRLDRTQEAIEAFRQAIRVGPEDADVLYNLGVAYARSGNRTAALEAVNELRRLDSEAADKLFNTIAPR